MGWRALVPAAFLCALAVPFIAAKNFDSQIRALPSSPAISMQSRERRAIYDTAELRRTEACLSPGASVPTPERALFYNNTNWSVSIAYPNWASARILGEMHYILISERMGYQVHLFDTNALYSSHPINYAAGCRDGDDTSGDTCNIDQPLVHYTVETWMAGYRRSSALPEQLKPTLLRTLDYPLLDQYFIWGDVLDAGLNSQCRVMLDDYRAYQRQAGHKMNASYHHNCADVAEYFDSWQDVYEMLGRDAVSECSVLDTDDNSHAGGLRFVDRYIELTGDTAVECRFVKSGIGISCILDLLLRHACFSQPD